MNKLAPAVASTYGTPLHRLGFPISWAKTPRFEVMIEVGGEYTRDKL